MFVESTSVDELLKTAEATSNSPARPRANSKPIINRDESIESTSSQSAPNESISTQETQSTPKKLDQPLIEF